MHLTSLAIRVAARHANHHQIAVLRGETAPHVRRVGVDGGDDDVVRLLQRRLERIADRGRELLQRAISEPTLSHDAVLKGISRLIAEAERKTPQSEG
jgi:hypothetical protein